MSNAKPLTEKALLVAWSTPLWTARKFDAQATGEVATAKHVSDDGVRVTKDLLVGARDTYKACQQTRNAARTDHYTNTLPWDDEGWRLLPSANWIDYSQAMQAHEQAINSADSAFFAVYPALEQSAPSRLNGLYRAEDWPDLSRVQSLCSVSLKFRPLPSADDIRVDLGNTDLDAIRESVTTQANNAIAEAMKDPWQRLLDCAKAMAERLADPNAVFRDTLVSNVREVCDILPKLNLTDDANLEAMRQRVLDDLAEFEPQELRDSKALRSDIARKAAQLKADLAGYVV